MTAGQLVFLVYWAVMVYYFLMALYQQRKDRSILFWNSMPVSDTLTELSKVIAGLFLVQGVYLLIILLINLVLMTTLAIYGMFFDIDVWQTIIAPANIMSRFLWSILFGFVNVFWCLPVYAWFLLASAWRGLHRWHGRPRLLCLSLYRN